MRKISVSMFVLVATLFLVPEEASARRFRRANYNSASTTTYSRTNPSTVIPTVTVPTATITGTTTPVTISLIPTTLAAGIPVTTASATTAITESTEATVSAEATQTTDVSTAQGVANLMARYGRVGHFGGNPGYEGCGCGATPEAAYNICCYANSRMRTVDVGYAQGSNGMWYCCRRYQ